jgi:serine/threonine-protein kinase
MALADAARQRNDSIASLLRQADARVKELESRERELEARGREIGQLNVDLGHQVAERSRELAEVLARSAGVTTALPSVGEVFDGRYRVVRELGRGGMGAVYAVERSRDGRRLALKIVTGAASGRHAARFAREAEIGARIQHEHLVSIFDVGVAAGGAPFLVMELVEGGSLEDQRARFGDEAWAVPILRQIASGLAKLHANRVIHRDLKPANVLLVDAGVGQPPIAKISDFGISRFGAVDDSADLDGDGVTVDASANQEASHRDLTQAGALMGTPLYMPPEAWFGPVRHPSADVFSFGVVAYEALTGRAPFDLEAIARMRAGKSIPSPSPLSGVRAEVAALVLRCLRAEPSERPTAKAIAEADLLGATRQKLAVSGDGTGIVP